LPYKVLGMRGYCHSVTVLTRPVFNLLNSVLPVLSVEVKLLKYWLFTAICGCFCFLWLSAENQCSSHLES